MTKTYQGFHAFTAPTWLVAKEPDHLTTCNTVESGRVLFTQCQPCRERPEILHERDTSAKKHSTQRLLCSRIAVFNSHCRELDDPVEMRRSGKLMPEWKHYGVPDLYGYGLNVMPTIKRYNVNLGPWIRNHVHSQQLGQLDNQRQKYILHGICHLREFDGIVIWKISQVSISTPS